MIIPNHTPLGELIKQELLSVPIYHPEFGIERFVIMPDHIHFVVNVKKRLSKPLGSLLAGFFGACSKHHSKLKGLSYTERLFHPFHDNIIFNKKQLDRAIRYIEDNPRRLIIKRQVPYLFKKYLEIKIDGHTYSAFGNIFLLRGVQLFPIRIHRKWSEKEMSEYKNACVKKIEEGGAIPISPAIHFVEKEIISIALEIGSPVIRLTENSFDERFKPSGKEFDICAEGRLLLLSPKHPDVDSKKSGYKSFHTMNDLALDIANLPASTRCCILSTCLNLNK